MGNWDKISDASSLWLSWMHILRSDVVIPLAHIDSFFSSAFRLMLIWCFLAATTQIHPFGHRARIFTLLRNRSSAFAYKTKDTGRQLQTELPAGVVLLRHFSMIQEYSQHPRCNARCRILCPQRPLYGSPGHPSAKNAEYLQASPLQSYIKGAVVPDRSITALNRL